MKRSLIVHVLFLAAFALPVTAQTGGFSEASLEGGYAFKGASHSRAWIGFLVFDGKGNITSGERSARGGSGEYYPPYEQSITGTYTVNADGTGTASITVEPPYVGGSTVYNPVETFDQIIILNGGREIWFRGSVERTDTGQWPGKPPTTQVWVTRSSATAYKQDPSPCPPSNPSIRSSYVGRQTFPQFGRDR